MSHNTSAHAGYRTYGISHTATGIIIVLLVLLTASSCTVTERLTVSDKAFSETTVKTTGWYLDVLDDMSSMGGRGGADVMDRTMEAVATNIDGMDGVRGVALYGTKDGARYVMTVKMADLAAFCTALGGDLVEYGEGYLRFGLDMDNYGVFEELVPALADPELEVYGPRYSNGMSKEEYLEMMTFLLGEESADRIDGSKVILDVETPGAVLSVDGSARITGHSTVRIEFPLTDLLTLNERLEAAVKWSVDETSD